MALLHDIAPMRERVNAWRAEGERVVLVPTMGNLHAGHLSLVEQARAAGDRVVVTVFVNPLQFAPGEDFDRYPRTLKADLAALEPLAPDLVFAPSVDAVYPSGHPIATRVVVEGLAERFCGAFREGHFIGAATVVTLLFNLIRPDAAIFGAKDYQQLLVFRRMAADLHMDVEILAGDTVREADGLAMSSRNQYLGDAERAAAPELYRTLCWVAETVAAGERDFAALEAAGVARLEAAGFAPQYLRIVTDSLDEPIETSRDLRVLGAAVLGGARLIDNVGVTRAVTPSPA